ncbi:MAG: hypothetical protein EVJ47_05925 [Candidatus Acidulodesulfobacterium ferriphilum]|uniref:Uncharacterized protein n=1 Tax=Candidatus Acidulodesulfobacterium ferriphilum TaxID=2597223 RepID=A0A519BA98_9DELT|nr:MAG: hypothetical protein EVJ47_05925 [Candidatus Acidulodesulfobacterium ferriphilum]
MLKNNLNERSITHKLAEYIQKYFSDYNVDCEYNRMPNKRNNNGEAEAKFIPKELNLSVSKTRSNDDKGTTVYPDIIIHKRGSNKSNLIVIEAKKKANVTKKLRLKVSDLFILILPTAFAVAGSFCFYCYKKKKKVFFLGCLKFLKKIYLFPMTLLR